MGEEFTVVTNEAGRVSVWPVGRPDVLGWKSGGFTGSWDACIEYVDGSYGDSLQSSGWSGPDAAARLITEIFHDVASTCADSTALVDAHESWSFERMRRNAGAITARLQAAGHASGARVGILVGRSNWFVAGVFGAMDAGLVVVPLDPAEPADRLRVIVESAHVSAILADPDMEGLAASLAPVVIVRSTVENADIRPIPASLGPADLAYIIFTSGSTGLPKGVGVTHGALANLIGSHQRGHHAKVLKATGRPVRVAHTTSVAFDLSWDSIAWVLSGNSLNMVPEETRRNIPALLQYFDLNQIDVFEGTPSQVEQMLVAGYLGPDTWQPAFIAVGGEAVAPALWASLRDVEPLAHNFYGPTEFTVDALLTEITGALPVVGFPPENCYVRILDEAGRPAGPGERGEIYLGGPQLAAGYVTSAGQTAERFLPDPFSSRPGAALYRTGDFGRDTPGGVEFLGRADRQFKIAGFRVELGEIEVQLAEAPNVVQAAVVAVVHEQRVRRLAAFVVLTAGASVNEALEFLRSRLPGFMMPSVTAVDAIPLRPSGKIDEAALLAHEQLSQRPGSAEQELSGLEEMVARAMGSMLGLTVNDREADFFSLGGTSLSAVELVTRLNGQLGLTLPHDLLCESSTVAGMGRYISALGPPSGEDADDLGPPD